jgi:hypothetical protein
MVTQNIISKWNVSIIVGTGWIDFDHFSNQEPYVVYSKILVMDFKSMLLTKEMY